MKEPKDCSLYDNGRCLRFHSNGKCQPVTSGWFNDRLEQCEMNEVCQNNSIYGNYYFVITDEDIEALKEEKILYALDEYGTFIRYESEEVMKDA